MHHPLLWIDMETTGLSPNHDRLLEVGLILTDGDLGEVASTNVVIGWKDPRAIQMVDFVRNMHEGNGLFDEVEESRLSLRDAEDHLIEWVRDHDAAQLYMAGSGVHFDRRWGKVLLPAFIKVFHHRNFDMTTLRYFFGAEKNQGPHRALPDLRVSVEDLRRYERQATRAGLMVIPAAVA